MADRTDLPVPPFYVDRETGARHLCISTDTWDRMVDAGELPPPTIRVRSRPRWRWDRIVSHLEGHQVSSCTAAPDEDYDPISERIRSLSASKTGVDPFSDRTRRYAEKLRAKKRRRSKGRVDPSG